MKNNIIQAFAIILAGVVFSVSQLLLMQFDVFSSTLPPSSIAETFSKGLIFGIFFVLIIMPYLTLRAKKKKE